MNYRKGPDRCQTQLLPPCFEDYVPADADGFFGEDKGLFALGVEHVLGFNTANLVRSEVASEHGVGVDFDGREDGRHRSS